MTCQRCGGSGAVTTIEVEAACCGNYLPSGECCAARYGTDRLIPEQVEVPIECPDCGGNGWYETP